MTRKELKDLIFECYVNVLRKRYSILSEDEDKDKNMVFGEGGQLPDSTDQMLAKFPTLKHALIRLHSEQYKDFVDSIDWVSPKPSVFRINLSNGQDYTLKWMGKDFEANISGKDYYLGQLIGFQQALQKLTDLYQEGPVSTGEDEEAPEGGSDEGGSGGGGGGSFPGSDFGGEPGGEEAPGEEGGSEGEEAGGDEGGEDMSGQDIDFEADDI